MKILVTGAAGGLGRFLAEKLAADPLTRSTPFERLAPYYDVIVHCAFNKAQSAVGPQELRNLVNDNIGLAQKLASHPHGRFIFISSVDVYPADTRRHDETETLKAEEARGLYGLTKLMAEALLQQSAANCAILRPGLLVGPYMKKNNLVRLLVDPEPKLSLAAASDFNIVTYDDMLNLISAVIATETTGIINAVLAGNATLAEIAEKLGRENVTYGGYLYQTGNIGNARAQALAASFRDTSLTRARALAAHLPV